MPLPNRQNIERGLLEFLGDGRIHHDDDIVSTLVRRFGLSANDLREQTKNGRSKFGNEIDWVKGDLGEGKRGKKLIRKVAPKRYQILPAGLARIGANLLGSGEQPSKATGAVDPQADLRSTDILGEEFDEESELQKALRANVAQLEADLKIIDGGTERVVPSGRIDITAEDKNGAIVVIELKRGLADRDAIGQIAGYMGDVSLDSDTVRGILIAHEFSSRALAAARMVHRLELRRYGYRFTFEKIR